MYVIIREWNHNNNMKNQQTHSVIKGYSWHTQDKTYLVYGTKSFDYSLGTSQKKKEILCFCSPVSVFI